jgi:ribosome modulation factor
MKRVQFLLGAQIGICELMCSFGISKKLAREQFEKALRRGFQRGQRRPSKEFRPITNLADICRRWHIEEKYLDESGKPKPLSWNGKSGTLLNLARLVNGDGNARRVVRDLVVRRLVTKTRSGKWLPRSQIVAPQGYESAQFLRTATMMERLLRTIAYNSERNYKGKSLLLEVMAQVPSLPARELSGFKKFAQAQGLLFAKMMDDWLESRNLRLSQRKRLSTREAGVVAFAFEQPSIKR